MQNTSVKSSLMMSKLAKKISNISHIQLGGTWWLNVVILYEIALLARTFCVVVHFLRNLEIRWAAFEGGCGVVHFLVRAKVKTDGFFYFTQIGLTRRTATHRVPVFTAESAPWHLCKRELNSLVGCAIWRLWIHSHLSNTQTGKRRNTFLLLHAHTKCLAGNE